MAPGSALLGGQIAEHLEMCLTVPGVSADRFVPDPEDLSGRPLFEAQQPKKCHPLARRLKPAPPRRLQAAPIGEDRIEASRDGPACDRTVRWVGPLQAAPRSSRSGPQSSRLGGADYGRRSQLMGWERWS